MGGQNSFIHETTQSRINRPQAKNLTIFRKEGVARTMPDANSPYQVMHSDGYVEPLNGGAPAPFIIGDIDCSANPNYPATPKGAAWRVVVSGKIGGVAGIVVEAGDQDQEDGDIIYALVDSLGGDQAAVGDEFTIWEGEEIRTWGRGTGTNAVFQRGSNVAANASGNDSTAAGNCVASANGASAFGHNNTASGVNSHVTGFGNTASGENATAIGEAGTSSGRSSHTQGSTNVASGDYSHAEGNQTQATASAAHAEGSSTQATAANAHAEGDSSIASGADSHAEGQGCQAQTVQAHAQGLNTIASGTAAHSEGNSTNATGFWSHSEGKDTVASGQAAHSGGEGFDGAEIVASGLASFAHAYTEAIAAAQASFIGGGDTQAIDAAATNAGIIGGSSNSIAAAGIGAVIAGGSSNNANEANSFIGGGATNVAGAATSGILAGANNVCAGVGSAIAGGDTNTAGGVNSFIGGGNNHLVNAFAENSAIIGGQQLTLNLLALRSVMLGGTVRSESAPDYVNVPSMRVTNCPEFADDAAAVLGGLTFGALYKTTAGGSSVVKIVA